MTWNRGDDREPLIILEQSKDTRRVFVTSSTNDGTIWSQPREITADVAAECARLVHEHISPIDDVRASAQYRGWVAEAVVARMITDTAREAGA